MDPKSADSLGDPVPALFAIITCGCCSSFDDCSRPVFWALFGPCGSVEPKHAESLGHPGPALFTNSTCGGGSSFDDCAGTAFRAFFGPATSPEDDAADVNCAACLRSFEASLRCKNYTSLHVPGLVLRSLSPNTGGLESEVWLGVPLAPGKR